MISAKASCHCAPKINLITELCAVLHGQKLFHGFKFFAMCSFKFLFCIVPFIFFIKFHALYFSYDFFMASKIPVNET